MRRGTIRKIGKYSGSWSSFAQWIVRVDGKPERLRVVCASKLGYAGNMEWGHFMKNEKIYQMDFSKVYHLLVNKAER